MSIRTLRDLSTGLFALEGSEYINDTETHLGNFFRFHAFTDSVIDEIEAVNLSGNSPSGLTVPAKNNLDCQFFAIKLTSGRGIAHKLSGHLPPGVIAVQVAFGVLTYSYGSETITWNVSGPDISVQMDATDLMVSVTDGIATFSGHGLAHTCPVTGSDPDAPIGVFLPSFASGICTFTLDSSPYTFVVV